MQEKIIWFWMQLKTCLISPGFYLQLICMVAVVLLAGSISIPDGKNLNAGIYAPAGGYAPEIIENIRASESVFTFHIYDSREKLDSDVVPFPMHGLLSATYFRSIHHIVVDECEVMKHFQSQSRRQHVVH